MVFDDSLLATQESMANVDWDNLESFGTAAEGQHLMTVISVNGYMQNFKDYTGPRAKVKLLIKEGADKGKFVYDDINLPHALEKDGNVKRRALIASRMGLIPKGTHDTVKVNWKDLEGQGCSHHRDSRIFRKGREEKGSLRQRGVWRLGKPLAPELPQPPQPPPPQDTPTFNSKTAACLRAGRQQGGFFGVHQRHSLSHPFPQKRVFDRAPG